MKNIVFGLLLIGIGHLGFAQQKVEIAKKTAKKTVINKKIEKVKPVIEEITEIDDTEEMPNVQGKPMHKEIKATVKETGVPGKKTLRIVKNINGKVQVTEKEINDVDFKEGMLIEELGDTIGDGKVAKKTKIIIEEDDSKFNWEDGNINRTDPDGVGVFKRRGFNNQNMREFNYQLDRLHDNLAQLPEKWEYYNPFNGSNQNWNGNRNNPKELSSIQELEVYTNKPDKEVINISFIAVSPGIANITVLDAKGEVVAKTETKKIEGEYVGQIKLNTTPKGVYFVIVTLNGDGSTRKLRID